MKKFKDFNYTSLKEIGFFEKQYATWTKNILKKPATLVLYRSGSIHWVWVWTFTLDGKTFYGRTLSQLKSFTDRLSDHLDGAKILTFVPRLSEDVIYLRQYLELEDHQIMTDTRGSSDSYQARHEALTLQCAEKLTGYYIDEMIEDWDDFSNETIYQDDNIQPMIPQLEKRARRFQDCIEAFMDAFGVTPETCPKTLAGFAKQALREAGWLVKNRDIMQIDGFSRETATEMIFPDYNLAKNLTRLRRGGDSLPSRRWIGKLVEGPVYSDDFKSEYPCVLVDEKFPCGKFERLDDPTDLNLKSLLKGDHAFFGRFLFTNLRTESDFPYVDCAHVRTIVSGKVQKFCNRIVSAETAVLWLTERDFRIVAREYQFDSFGICELYYQRKEYLPRPITSLITYLFQQKEDTSHDYSTHKIVLNAISGIMGINLFRDEDLSEKAYHQKIKDALVPPQIYTWMTAYGRYALREMLWEAGDKAVYAAVDCVKHLQPIDFKCAERWKERSKKRGAVTKDSKKWLGMIHTEWVASRFVAVGPACYAFEEITDEPVYDLTPKEISWAKEHKLVPEEGTEDYLKKQRVQITISGVPAQIGGLELISRGGLEVFKKDFEFHALPRRRSKIVPKSMGRSLIDGHWVETSDYLETKWCKDWLIGADESNLIEDIFDIIELKEHL